jgi:hypothetical protein
VDAETLRTRALALGVAATLCDGKARRAMEHTEKYPHQAEYWKLDAEQWGKHRDALQAMFAELREHVPDAGGRDGRA